MSIFDEQISRKPDLYPWTEQFISAMHEGFWTDKEFSFSSDKQDFKVKLTDEEREIIIRCLSAIGQIEIAVKTFWVKLGENLPHPSIQDMGIVFGNSEVIHNNAYERLLDELGVTDAFEKNLNLEWMKGRVNYLRKYTHKYYKDSKKQFLYSLILFTLFVENVSLFSQFYVIRWFGLRGLLKDANQQTLYSAQEEKCHYEGGCKLVNTIREELPELFDSELSEKIIHESQEAFKAESKIIDWMIGDLREPELSAEILKEFVKNRINDSLEAIGFGRPLEVDAGIVDKTTWFDEQILGNNHSDFFHIRPVEYARANKSYDDEDLF